MQRCSDVLEEDDLLLCKSSYRDLNDGDTAVAKEGKSYDEVKERNPAVDQEECDEEAEASGACISHQHFRRVEVVKKICNDRRDKDDQKNDRVPVGQGKCHESHKECCKYREDREGAGKSVDAVCGVCGVDGYDEEDHSEKVEDYRIKVEICACDGDIDSCAEEMDADEGTDEGYDEIEASLKIFVPCVRGSVIEPARDHGCKSCDKAQA